MKIVEHLKLNNDRMKIYALEKNVYWKIAKRGQLILIWNYYIKIKT